MVTSIMQQAVKEILSRFPRLHQSVFCLASIATERYNCIALAIGVGSYSWWPTSTRKGTKNGVEYYWPPSLPLTDEPTTFVRLFQGFGDSECQSAECVPGIEKVALFKVDQEIRHASRQLPSGKWWSKLGPKKDIIHELSSLDEGIYGSECIYLQRHQLSVGEVNQLLRQIMTDYAFPEELPINNDGLIILQGIYPIDEL